MKKKTIIALAIFSVVLPVGIFQLVLSQPAELPPQSRDPLFTFTAKWICHVPVPGVFFNPADAEKIGLVPGEYKTDINVHNPSFSVNTLGIKKKFILSVRESPNIPHTPKGFSSTVLGPNAAFFIDCEEIYKVLGLPPGPAKGFVELITTTTDLNVVAEYSSLAVTIDAAGALTPAGISLDVERIPVARFVP